MISGCLKSLIILLLVVIAFLVLFISPFPLGVISSLPLELIVIAGVGIILFVGISAFLGRLSGWVSTAQLPGKKQVVVVKHETNETPSDIVRAAIGATFWLFVIFVCLSAIVVALVFPVDGVFIGAGPLDVLRSLIESIRN